MKTKKPRLMAFAAFSLGALVLSGCAGTEPAATNTSSSTPQTEMTSDANNPQLLPPAAGDKIAVIETDFGTIKVKLFAEQTPETVKNIEELANAGKYTDVPFHRISKNFVIQTGDFTSKDGQGGHSYKGPGTFIPNETNSDLTHLYGAVGMARRPQKDTNGSQFYIVTNKKGTHGLDGDYTVFGQVYEGMDVVEKIAAVDTDLRSERPLKDVLMKSMTVMPYNPSA